VKKKKGAPLGVVRNREKKEGPCRPRSLPVRIYRGFSDGSRPEEEAEDGESGF
jgi:hypothetical protein